MHRFGPWKVRLVCAFFCAYLAVQIVVPLRGLLRNRPSQFCWFMFTGREQRLGFRLHFDDSRSVDLRDDHGLRRKARLYRLDADRERFLPPHLCATEPSLRGITIRRLDSGERVEYSCAR